MTPTALELTETAVLLAELAKRFENTIFVGQKGYETDAKERKKIMWRYRGDPFMCLGLASTMTSILNEDIALNTEMADPSNI